VAKAEYEMGFAPRFDRIVINDNLDEAKQQTLDTLRKFLSEEQ
jgi:guanylate kinase